MAYPNLGGKASQRVWGHVSGMPSRLRAERRLLVLQAFFDESEKGGIFVMAGYVSSIPKWAAFSDEWDVLLNNRSGHFPRLDEFHMNAMHNTPARREMVPLFYRVIEKHVDALVSVSINVKQLNEEFASFQWPEWLVQRELLKNPYFHCFFGIFWLFRNYSDRLGITPPVDFMFDEHNHDEEDCLKGWKQACTLDPEFERFFGERPRFGKSNLNMPLQAADLIAYWIRKWDEDGVDVDPRELPFGWWKPERVMPTLMASLAGDNIRKTFEKMVAVGNNTRSGVASDASNTPHWRPPNVREY
jgi:hypothetical protein